MLSLSDQEQETRMERDLFRRVCSYLRRLGQRRRDPRQVYTDARILAVYFWAVINDRPTVWATLDSNWPRGLRRGNLPSQSRLSRRLRSSSVRALLDRLERLVLYFRRRAGWVCAVDSKPLPVGPHSQDPHARWGRSSGGLAKGYRLSVLRSARGVLLAWRLSPMNGDEREMARRMLRDTHPEGYVLGDKNFDSNTLHDLASEGGGQLVAERRKGAHRGLGRGYQSPARLRCRDLLENTISNFGQELLQVRNGIERFFGTLTCTHGLLASLPAWTRTYPRVRPWVCAKLILAQIRTDRRTGHA